MNLGKQEVRVLDFMKLNGCVTRADAINFCGVANLTAVISTLRRKGENIGGRSVEHVNKFGEKVTRHEYFLQGGRKNGED